MLVFFWDFQITVFLWLRYSMWCKFSFFLSLTNVQRLALVIVQICASGIQSVRAWNLVGEWSHLLGMFENNSCTLRSWLQSNIAYWDSYVTKRKQCWDWLYILFLFCSVCLVFLLFEPWEKISQTQLFDCLVLTYNLLKRFCIALSWHDTLGSASAPVRHFSAQLKKKGGGVTHRKASPTLCLSVLLWTHFK